MSCLRSIRDHSYSAVGQQIHLQEDGAGIWPIANGENHQTWPKEVDSLMKRAHGRGWKVEALSGAGLIGS
jgi:hypothetical protein